MADGICTVDGCEKPKGVKRSELCEMHQSRRKRTGLTAKRQRRFCHCGGTAFGNGLCRSHYMRARRVDPTRPTCSELGCIRPAQTRGYCSYHYTRNCLPEWLATHRANPARRAQTLAWQQAHPERMSELRSHAKHMRRAREAGAAVSKVDLAAILAEYGMVCHICGGDIATRADLNFDHVIPLSKGGPHTPENIRPSHAACNRRKGARLSV